MRYSALAEADAPSAAVDPGGSATARAASPRSWWLCSALLAVHAVFVWLTVTRHLDFLFNDARHRLGPGTDLAAYYDAGAAWLRQQSILGSGAAFGYRYHPFLAMTAGATLARLPFSMALALWVALIEVLLLADLMVFRRLVVSTGQFLAIATLFLLFSPFYLDLYMGNASFISGSLLLLAWFSDRVKMRVLFVTLVVVSILVKPIGLVLVPWLLVRRRFADAALIVGLVALLAVPYFCYHPQDWRALLDVNIQGRTPGWLVHAGNQGLHGFFGALFTRLSGIPTWKLASYDQLSLLPRLLLTALPLLLLAITLRASWLVRGRPEVGIFLWSCVYLLGFHDVWEHSYSFLILGLGLLWTTDFVPKRLLIVCSIGLALPTAFALYDLRLPPGPYDPEHGWSTAVSLLHHATKPAWLLVLYMACVWRAEHDHQNGGDGSDRSEVALRVVMNGDDRRHQYKQGIDDDRLFGPQQHERHQHHRNPPKGHREVTAGTERGDF